jgi:hypothetical protein
MNVELYPREVLSEHLGSPAIRPRRCAAAAGWNPLDQLVRGAVKDRRERSGESKGTMRWKWLRPMLAW